MKKYFKECKKEEHYRQCPTTQMYMDWTHFEAPKFATRHIRSQELVLT